MVPGSIKAFAYLTAEKAAFYRRIVAVFVAAKSRFSLHLRPADIVAELQGDSTVTGGDQTAVEIDAALQQLCEWGNLDRHPDTADVKTVEDFYRPRFLYQLTATGEAAAHAAAEYERAIGQPGELQATALSDIQAHLVELLQLANDQQSDPAKVHQVMVALRGRFEQLTSRAQAFMGGLQRRVDLHQQDLQGFLKYKTTLIDYIDRFIGQMTVMTGAIAQTIEQIEATDVERLLAMVADRELADRLTKTPDDLADEMSHWRRRWQGLRSWFIGQPDQSSQGELLRARALASITVLLIAVAGIHDRRMMRSDRSADLRTLARWFSECDTDSEAHRLWRAAFGLASSRHLHATPDVIAELDQRLSSSQASWLDAPVQNIRPHLRGTTPAQRRQRTATVVDMSHQKALLARVAAAQSAQIAAARMKLAEGRLLRLSELSELNADQFQLFLDLLAEALSAATGAETAVSITSSDGTVRVDLGPVQDGRWAVIRTSMGVLRGRDRMVTFTDLVGEACEPDAVESRGVKP